MPHRRGLRVPWRRPLAHGRLPALLLRTPRALLAAAVLATLRLWTPPAGTWDPRRSTVLLPTVLLLLLLVLLKLLLRWRRGMPPTGVEPDLDGGTGNAGT